MIGIRRTDGLGFPNWVLPQSISARRAGPVWTDAKEVYVRRAGPVWTKIWHENNWGAINTQHPHWEYAFNFDFLKTTTTNGDISWGTYFSTNNAGFYTYPTSGQLKLSVGARDGNGYGNVFLETAYPLRVNAGQTYTNNVTVNARTTTTLMSLRAYTSNVKADAQKGSSNRTPFETPLTQVAAGTTVSQSITIPSGHSWVRLYLYIETTAALPRDYTFSQWRFRRTA